MNLDELRIILLSERESGRLVQIPQDLFSSAKKNLDELYTELHDHSDPFSDEAQLKIRAKLLRRLPKISSCFRG